MLEIGAGEDSQREMLSKLPNAKNFKPGFISSIKGLKNCASFKETVRLSFVPASLPQTSAMDSARQL